MGLEIPGVETIETAEQARTIARRWKRMAAEVDTPDAPDEAKAKARELRQKADAAYTWARRHEDAIAAGHKAAGEHPDASRVDGGDAVRRIHGERGKSSLAGLGGTPHAHGPRRAAHEAYQRSRPPAMRIVHRGRQHFFQGVSEPFGPVGDGFDLLMEVLGLTVGVVFFSLLLRSPSAVTAAGSHTLGFIQRAVEPVDPITGGRVGSTPTHKPAAAAAVGGKAATGQGG